MSTKRNLNIGLALVAFLTATLMAIAVRGQEHQRGNVPILEGHQVHKYPIFLTEALSPGEHELGTLQMDGIGKVSVAVVVGKDGMVSDIKTRWPKEVKPEILSNTSHDVYRYGPGGITVAGKSKCENVHAAGSCDGCSSYIWVEVSQFKP